MSEYKNILVVASIILSLISYASYFRNIFKGKIKPHAFTWFIWIFLNCIALAAQIAKGAGVAAWATAFTVIICLLVFITALWKGNKKFPLFDWFAFAGALIALFLWWITNDPTASIILVVIITTFSFLPIFRKAYYKPMEENAVTFYFLNIVKWPFAILALESFNFVNWIYPAALIFLNGIVLFILLLGRKNCKTDKNPHLNEEENNVNSLS